MNKLKAAAIPSILVIFFSYILIGSIIPKYGADSWRFYACAISILGFYTMIVLIFYEWFRTKKVDRNR